MARDTAARAGRPRRGSRLGLPPWERMPTLQVAVLLAALSSVPHGSVCSPAPVIPVGGSECTDGSSVAGKGQIPDIFGMCCPDVEIGKYGYVSWPATDYGKIVERLCPYGPRPDQFPFGFAKVYRQCIYRANGPEWGASDYSRCAEKNDSQDDDDARAAEEAESMTSDPRSMTEDDFLKAAELIETAHGLARTNRTVARNMLQAMSNMLAVPADVQEGSDAHGTLRRRLFRLIETHGRGVLLMDNETQYEQRFENLHLSVRRVPPDEDDTGRPTSTGPWEFASSYAGGVDGGASSAISLPSEVIRQVRERNPSLESVELRVRFMAIRNAVLLSPPGSSTGRQPVVSASVSLTPPNGAVQQRATSTSTASTVSVRTFPSWQPSPTATASSTPSIATTTSSDDDLDDGSDFSIGYLENPVLIRIPFDGWGTAHVCAYYDVHDGEWRSDGLRTRLDRDGVTCESSHLTPFTTLLDPYPRRNLQDLIVPLNILGYLGSTLSVLGLAATIVTYQFLSRFGEDRWGRVLVQLCISLVLLHAAYLASNFKGIVPGEACVAIAVLVHLFLLSSFCWMFVEALLLYQLLITVFQSAHGKFVLKRLIFAWGTPVVIVVACGWADPYYYLDTHPDFCVASGANPVQHGLVTLLPCGLVLVANVLIFFRLSLVLLGRRKSPTLRLTDAPAQPSVTWAQIRGMIGVAFLLGVTWLLSPLAAESAVLQVASSALNGFQGVAIFVSRVLTHPEARRSWGIRLFPKAEYGASSASYSVTDKNSSWFQLRWGAASGTVASPPPLMETKSKAKGFGSCCRPWRRCLPTSGSSSNVVTSELES